MSVNKLKIFSILVLSILFFGNAYAAVTCPFILGNISFQTAKIRTTPPPMTMDCLYNGAVLADFNGCFIPLYKTQWKQTTSGLQCIKSDPIACSVIVLKHCS